MLENLKSKWKEFGEKHPTGKKIIVYGGLATIFIVEGKIMYEAGVKTGSEKMAHMLFHWLNGEFPEETYKILNTTYLNPGIASKEVLSKYYHEQEWR